MKQELIKLKYQGCAYSFNEDGWFNATEAARAYGKRPVDYLALESTREYLEALAESLRSEESSLLIIKRGGRGKSDSTWMHPKLAVAFARWLDMRFAVWCDIQIDGLLRGNHPRFDWKRLRHEASSSYKVLSQILQRTRQREGKVTAPHHFTNEARLINWALTSNYGKVDRNLLTEKELDLLSQLETLDSVLIGSGMDYEARKVELVKYARERRMSHIQKLGNG